MWYIDTIPTDAWVSKWWATVKTETKNNWSNIPLKILNPNRSATSSLIANEEKEEKVSKQTNLNDWLAERSNYRKKIFSWEISTWDKWADTWEVRKGRLADLARWTLIDLGKDPDNIKKISDDDLIKRLTSDAKWVNQTKLDLVNDYIKNGWYADEVYAKLTSNEKIEKKWFRESAIESAAAVPTKTMLDMVDLSNNISSKISDWISEIFWISKDKSDTIVGNANFVLPWLWSPLYQLTNSIQKLTWWWSDESYNEAVDNWYDWTKKEFEEQNKLTNHVRDILPKDEEYNKQWKRVWDFAWEVAEFALAPEMKLKYLSKVPKVWKFLEWATKLAAEWAEFQALEDLNKWELSSVWDYWKAALMNMWVGWVLRSLSKGFTKIPSKKAAAISTKTEAEWNNMSKITDNYVKNQNTEVTPYTMISNLLKDAKSKLKDRRLAEWKSLEEARKWLTYWGKEYTAREVLDDIWNAFEWLKANWTWWEQALTPKFNVSKSWRTLKIDNKDVLNTITKNDNWVKIKLWDEIENLWREMFNTTDKKINAQTTDEFIRRVKSILKDEWWNWASWEWLKTVRSALDTIEENFTKSLTEDSAKVWKEARDITSQTISVDKAFDDLIWRLDNPKTTAKISNMATYSKPEMEELFRIVKEETWVDLNNEIWAWTLNLSLRDPKLAEKLIDTIYPSQPWAMEFIMKSVTNRAKRAGSSRYTKDYTESAGVRAAWIIPWMAANEAVNQ